MGKGTMVSESIHTDLLIWCVPLMAVTIVTHLTPGVWTGTTRSYNMQFINSRSRDKTKVSGPLVCLWVVPDREYKLSVFNNTTYPGLITGWPDLKVAAVLPSITSRWPLIYTFTKESKCKRLYGSPTLNSIKLMMSLRLRLLKLSICVEVIT